MANTAWSIVAEALQVIVPDEYELQPADATATDTGPSCSKFINIESVTE